MKVSPTQLVRAIPENEIGSMISSHTESLQLLVLRLVSQFLTKVEPQSTLQLEQSLFNNLLTFGRDILEQLLNSLEHSVEQRPVIVSHRDNNYRLLEGSSPREVVTRFGKIELVRSRYRRGRSGKVIFPLEISLGLQNGFTPLAASMTGQQFATTGSSQGRTIEFVKEHLACSIGTERLRKLGQHLAREMEPFREQFQREQLEAWLSEAGKTKAQSIVLSVSRDAVSLGIAPFGFFEMASVATISVLADGKRLGTVYLGRTPETNQKTLSNQLTSLLRATLRTQTKRPHVVYVTDAGKVETAYWHKVLSRFFVDGKRIKIHRVVDYYHASERLTVIADSLKFEGKDARREWLDRVRRLLLEPKGHGRVMRSISTMVKKYRLRKSKANDFKSAVNYLNNQKRYMNYSAMKSRHFPIGSGVVESACKQIVSERMKLAGMRWKKPGAQAVMTLRCIKLSNIWKQVFGKMLQAIQPVTPMTKNENPVIARSECA